VEQLRRIIQPPVPRTDSARFRVPRAKLLNFPLFTTQFVSRDFESRNQFLLNGSPICSGGLKTATRRRDDQFHATMRDRKGKDSLMLVRPYLRIPDVMLSRQITDSQLGQFGDVAGIPRSFGQFGFKLLIA
jgi:hypothetical protein